MRKIGRKVKTRKAEPGLLDVEMAEETTTTNNTNTGEEEPEVNDRSRGGSQKKRKLSSSMNSQGSMKKHGLPFPPSSQKAKRNWRNVTPAPESFLLGSEEGGFLSLEEIDGEDWSVTGSEPVSEEDPSVAAAEVVLDGGKKIPLKSSAMRKKKSSKRKRDQKGDSESVDLSLEDLDEDLQLPQAIGDDLELVNHQNLKKQRKKKKKGKSAEEGPEIPVVPTEDVEATDLEEKPTSLRKKPKLGSRARKLLKSQRDGGDRKQQPMGIKADASQVGGSDGVAESPFNSEDEVQAEEEKEKILMDMTSWAEMRLHSKLERAIAELGFKEPTPIQRQCIPAAAHKGKDVIGAAETGSGKTLAFGLPILQRLLQEEDKEALKQQQNLQDEEKQQQKATNENENEIEKQPLLPVRNLGPMRALVITPTRELALQICEHLKAAAKFTNFRVVPIVGGMAAQKQQRLLKQMPEIVVGTPGRLWELISMGESHLLEMGYLSFFVLDEADRMVEKGHFKELQSIIDMLPTTRRPGKDYHISEVNDGAEAGAGGTSGPTMARKKRQTLVFSATLALPVDFKAKLKKGHHHQQQQKLKNSKSVDSVAALSERAGVGYDAAIVDLTSSSIVAKELSESVIECRDEEKDRFLYYILKIHGGGRTIVFCTSISALRRASAILRLLQVPVWPLHAQMQQKARLKAMDRFRGTQDCVLVATDVAARGLDVPGVRTVVHYQLPHSAEIYVHRSGRTARASTEGISIALVSPSDRAKYSTLCQALNRPQGLQPFPVNMSYIPAVESRVSLAVQVDKLMRKQSQNKATESWLERNAEAMGIDLEASEDEEDGRVRPRAGAGASSSSKRQQQNLRDLQRELQELLSQPVKPKAFSNRYITGAGMTPLLAKQLQDYAFAKANPHEAAAALRKKGGKLLVIGQEQMEPLEALRLSTTGKVPPLLRKRQ